MALTLCRRCNDPDYEHYIDPLDGTHRCEGCPAGSVCRFLPPKVSE